MMLHLSSAPGQCVSFIMIVGWGVLSTKVYSGTCAEMHGSQNQPPGIMMTLFSTKTGMNKNIGHIFKIFLNWRENRPNFINLIP